jgi:hypothetical protein
MWGCMEAGCSRLHVWCHTLGREPGSEHAAGAEDGKALDFLGIITVVQAFIVKGCETIMQ